MEFKDYLSILVRNDGSDLYLTVGAPPAAKFQGALKPLENIKLTNDMLKDIAYGLMDADQQKAFEAIPEMNLAISEPGIGRFRINIFRQRNNFALVIRNIKVEIPNADKLGLPEVLKNIIMEKRGLILFVGGTGSGKSTSLAALIDHRNAHSSGHIITIEDPIEYIHPHKRCLVNQREVGVDTMSYEDALKNALRQAPDVILIGEIRSRETMEHALAFAETGHLCLSTLHANNSNQALDRILNFFPEERHNQLLLDLSLNLKAFVSQRLVPTVEGKRTAAIEILLTSQLVRDLILKGEIQNIKEAMEKSENIGMQTFDSHLMRLFKEGVITLEEALQNSDSPNNLKLKISLSEGVGSKSPVAGDDRLSSLSLEAMQKEDETEAGGEKTPAPTVALPKVAEFLVGVSASS
jgi:twitching motility protein PilU